MTRTYGLPLFLIALAVTGIAVNTLLDQYAARRQLAQVSAALTRQVEQFEKAEAQLNALASGTIALADTGDPVAAKVLEILDQNGVRIRK